jgi:hypothetical protein
MRGLVVRHFPDMRPCQANKPFPVLWFFSKGLSQLLYIKAKMP